MSFHQVQETDTNHIQCSVPGASTENQDSWVPFPSCASPSTAAAPMSGLVMVASTAETSPAGACKEPCPSFPLPPPVSSWGCSAPCPQPHPETTNSWEIKTASSIWKDRLCEEREWFGFKVLTPSDVSWPRDR